MVSRPVLSRILLRWSLMVFASLALAVAVGGGPLRAQAAGDAAPERDPRQGEPAEVPPRRADFAFDAGGRPQTAVVVELRGPIDKQLAFSFLRRLEIAKDRKPDVLIIDIDSPGGLLEESKEIAHHLRDIEWARTVAYIPGKALSGAAIIALGCDDIVMGPFARLGDVGVMFFDPDSFAFRYVPEKYVSDFVAQMRALAEAKGRPPALAEAMIYKDSEVFRVENTRTGQIHYMTEMDLKAADPKGQLYKKLNLVVETQVGRFLDMTGKRAVELGMAQATERDLQGVFNRYNVQGQPEVLRDSWIDSVIFYLNLPWVTAILFIVGLIALYAELQMPGIGAGAALSALCFALYFWSHWMGGTSGWLELLLFGLGVGCVLLEIFVIPGFGVTGLGGALLIVASLIMAGQRVVIPETEYDLVSLRNTVLSLVVAGFSVGGFAMLMRKRFSGGRSLFSNLILAPPGADPENSPTDPGLAETRPAANPLLGRPGDLVGKIGKTATALRPTGKIHVAGRNVDAVAADGEFIDRDRRVRLEEYQANRYVVREEESA